MNNRSRANNETLAEALLNEQQRVSELLPLYDNIPEGIFAATLMRAALAKSNRAVMSGDIVGMVAALEDLKGYGA